MIIFIIEFFVYLVKRNCYHSIIAPHLWMPSMSVDAVLAVEGIRLLIILTLLWVYFWQKDAFSLGKI
jgi:hypothetical protein